MKEEMFKEDEASDGLTEYRQLELHAYGAHVVKKQKGVAPNTPQLALRHMLGSLPRQARCRACWPR